MAFRIEKGKSSRGGTHKKFRRYFEVNDDDKTTSNDSDSSSTRHHQFKRYYQDDHVENINESGWKRPAGKHKRHDDNQSQDQQATRNYIGEDSKTYHQSGGVYKKPRRNYEDEGDYTNETSSNVSSSSNSKGYNENDDGQTNPANYMDEESKTYFSTVLNRMNEPFEDEEEKEMLLDNVVEQIIENKTVVVLSSLGGKTIQKALELNTKPQLIDKLLVSLQSDIETMSNNQYASITLQCLLLNCLKYVQTDNTSIHVVNFVVAASEFCAHNFPFNVSHPFQSHILKTVIHVLAGNTGFSLQIKRFPFKSVFTSVPFTFQEAFQKLTETIVSTENFSEYLQDNVFSVILQHVIQSATPFPEICKAVSDAVLKIFLETEPSENSIHPLLTSTSSRLIEAISHIMNAKQQKKFMRKYILKNLQMIIEDRYANNVLRTLIKTTPTKEDFEKLFKKLEPHFKLIFDTGHHSLFVAIADCCILFDTCQASLVVALKNVLQCADGNKQDQFVLCVLHMLTYEQFVKAESENSASVTLNGSLLVQRMLSFSKPIKIAMAIVNMSSDHLKRILCDPKGCHIADAFMNSKFVGEKSNEKLIAKVREIASLLACSMHGSRSIDAIWAVANLKQKVMLAESLSKNIDMLAANQFGKFINRKLALNHFKTRLEDWKQVQTSQDRKRKLFKDILETPEKETKEKWGKFK